MHGRITTRRHPAGLLPIGGGRLAALAGLVMSALAISGCATTGLTLSAGEPAQVVAPRQLDTVSIPFTIRWLPTSIGASRPAGSLFAVFVDRPPIEAGQNLIDIVDRGCKRSPGCANVAYFQTQGVYLTQADSVSVTRLAQQLGQPPKDNLHQAVIVLVDAAGNRIGSAATVIDFRLGTAPRSIY